MREHTEYIYTPKESIKGHCIFSVTDYIQSILLSTMGCLNNIYIFIDFRKIRISVFYMREHTELMYILQNRVEYDIAYFF